MYCTVLYCMYCTVVIVIVIVIVVIVIVIVIVIVKLLCIKNGPTTCPTTPSTSVR